MTSGCPGWDEFKALAEWERELVAADLDAEPDDPLPWLLHTSGDAIQVELTPGDYSVEVFCPSLAPTRAPFNLPRDK